jgi:hypothetical protein
MCPALRPTRQIFRFLSDRGSPLSYGDLHLSVRDVKRREDGGRVDANKAEERADIMANDEDGRAEEQLAPRRLFLRSWMRTPLGLNWAQKRELPQKVARTTW